MITITKEFLESYRKLTRQGTFTLEDIYTLTGKVNDLSKICAGTIMYRLMNAENFFILEKLSSNKSFMQNLKNYTYDKFLWNTEEDMDFFFHEETGKEFFELEKELGLNEDSS